MSHTYQERVESYKEADRIDLDWVTKDNKPIRALEIDNLSEKTSSVDLRNLLSAYGVIVSCVLQRRLTRTLFGCVTFYNTDDAFRVRKDAEQRKIVLHNRILRVTVARSYQQCENFYFTKFYMLPDDVLLHIFLFLPIADRIRLERVCKRWQALSQASWSHVRKLDFLKSTWGFSTPSRFGEIDQKIIMEVLARCSRYIKEIHFSKLPKIEDYTYIFLSVVELCPNLQVINASLVSLLTPMSSYSCPNASRNLRGTRSLSLKTTLRDDYDNNTMEKLLLLCPKLNHFMGCEKLYGYCLQFLPQTEIREIILTHCSCLDFNLLRQTLPRFENLLTLALYNDKTATRLNLQAATLETIATKWKKLQRFEIIGFNLDVASCKLHITRLINLEILILKNTNVNDEFLIGISAQCRKLTHLDISGCLGVTLGGIAALSSLPNLYKLVINDILANWEESAWWNLNADLVIHEPSKKYLFASLKHLECQNSCQFSPSEIYWLIASSPLLETVDFGEQNHNLRSRFEKIVTRSLRSNSKIAFLISYSYSVD